MLTRKKPMNRGTSQLKRSEFKRKTAMKPGSVPMKRATKPMAARSKTNAKRPDNGEKDLCKTQKRCYILIPGHCGTRPGSIVPCHSNQLEHGKGMGIKADHEKTVPGCPACHYLIDQAPVFTKAEKFGFWDAAYKRWKPVRDALMKKTAPCLT